MARATARISTRRSSHNVLGRGQYRDRATGNWFSAARSHRSCSSPVRRRRPVVSRRPAATTARWPPVMPRGLIPRLLVLVLLALLVLAVLVLLALLVLAVLLLLALAVLVLRAALAVVARVLLALLVLALLALAVLVLRAALAV